MNSASVSKGMRWDGLLRKLTDGFVPAQFHEDAEKLRLARLNIRFGLLGLAFGSAYAAFYLVLQHNKGAAIILILSSIFGLMPWVVKRTGNLSFVGHLFSAMLVVGFGGLAVIEGGLTGHAVGWLAAVPLMSLLLQGVRPAIGWTLVCSAVVACFVVAHTVGYEFPRTYPARWEALIDAAGYIGLVPFLAFLGGLFERTRAQAFDQLQTVLGDLSRSNDRLQTVLGDLSLSNDQLQTALADLSRSNGRLTQLNLDKDEFLNIAAHDLRNPLAGIIGYAGLLKLQHVPDAKLVREAGTTIESLGMRMNGILTNLLDVRSLEDGQMKFRQDRCSADEVVSEVVRSHRPQAEKKRITVAWEPRPEAPPFLGDRNATAQIFENLLSNAIKYSNPGSDVRCALETDEKSVWLHVEDNGPGLSEQDQTKLFKKFSRLSPQPTAGEPSNGLGLWIVPKMAQAMGGDVR
ncbi:MAG: sensor histidine kinase, partial [Prosthecobacter sp.]